MMGLLLSACKFTSGHHQWWEVHRGVFMWYSQCTVAARRKQGSPMADCMCMGHIWLCLCTFTGCPREASLPTALVGAQGWMWLPPCLHWLTTSLFLLLFVVVVVASTHKIPEALQRQWWNWDSERIPLELILKYHLIKKKTIYIKYCQYFQMRSVKIFVIKSLLLHI